MAPLQLDEVPPLELGESRNVKRGLQVCLLKNGPVSFMLGPKGEFPVGMPFQPSAFENSKKSAVFSVPPELAQKLAKLEEPLAEGGNWISCVKPPKPGYDATVKAKCEACAVYDESGAQSEFPDPWVRQRANAVLKINGTYQSTLGRGLLLEVTHAIIKPDATEEADVNPLV
jgi:hypothetical protein